MATIVNKGWEYSRFGVGWVRRERDTADDWQAVGYEDVPSEVIDEDAAIAARKRSGGRTSGSLGVG